jgi:hypothetical protein
MHIYIVKDLKLCNQGEELKSIGRGENVGNKD